MTKDEALKLALEHFETWSHEDSIFAGEFDKEITAIKEALAQPEHGWTPERIAGMARLKDAQDKRLAQPEQEPVQWGVDWGRAGDSPCVSIIKRLPDGRIEVVAVEYGPQRTWIGLTPQERDEINEQVYGAVPHHVAFHHAIEQALREKNT